MSKQQQQSDLWAGHLEDEAAELVRQQARAGGGHSPQERPLPHSKDDLREAVAAAVAAERERCAGVARAWADPDRLRQALGDLGLPQLDAAARTAQAVENEILRG